MGTNLMRALLLTSASVAMVATAAPTAAYAQEATYKIDIPAQSMGDALRALGKATKQNIVFSGSVVKGKRSAAVRGRMSASEALDRMLQGSGLKMSRGSGGGLVVQGGNGDAAPGRAETAASSSSSINAPSAAASTVVDARTGAALKGARVEIVETGEKTSTGDLGEFRFPGKTGSFNLRVSYLGYPQYEQFVDLKDGRATSGILLPDGSAAGEIVVTAYQSSRAQALNQERTADNVSTVISDDLTGQFDGTTISDALRRAPGVTFTPADATSDGNKIMVRGLSGAFNSVDLNGVELQSTDGVDRSPRLGNILADSVSKIVINKTLLPNQSGTGTGGLVEIETKGPLDRPARYFNLTVEGAKSDFRTEKTLSGTASWKFGASRNFGVSISGQYRKLRSQNFQITATGQFGKFLPVGAFSILDVNPATLFPFDDRAVEIYQSDGQIYSNSNVSEGYAFTPSVHWQIGDHTTLRLDYTRSRSKEGGVQSGLNFYPLYGYVEAPIDELGGEVRQALISEDAYEFLPGIQAVVTNEYSALQSENLSQVLSFRGESKFGKWEVNYSAGYSKGKSSSERMGASFYDAENYYRILDRRYFRPEIVADTTDGRIISLFGPLNGRNIYSPRIATSSG